MFFKPSKLYNTMQIPLHLETPVYLNFMIFISSLPSTEAIHQFQPLLEIICCEHRTPIPTPSIQSLEKAAHRSNERPNLYIAFIFHLQQFPPISAIRLWEVVRDSCIKYRHLCNQGSQHQQFIRATVPRLPAVLN
jgi:hypothetical protein